MAKPKVLLQLDADGHASVFDAIVAVDAGVDHLLQYHGVEPSAVRDLVYGAMFTRGPKDLFHTAVFIGGSDVAAGETLLAEVVRCFFGPLRVSVMLDANGANTTAAAAVLCAGRHTDLRRTTALVLGGTGPVGQRVARLLAAQGSRVRVASRELPRAQAVCQKLTNQVPDGAFQPVATPTPEDAPATLAGCGLVVAAGAAGAQLLHASAWQGVPGLSVAIDLNAVPPAGIEGIEAGDAAVDRHRTICYSALGVGGLKMKIHKAAIARLFLDNNQVLDAPEIFDVGRRLGAETRP